MDEPEKCDGPDEETEEYDDGPWTDEERAALRSKVLDSLGWEGMEVYQDME